MRELNREIKSLRPDLLICVDHEGGRVQRFRTDGFTRLPAMGQLGRLWMDDAMRATQAATSAGYVLGMRTRQLNRTHEYRQDFPAVNQLVAWSGWGLLDREFDNTDALLSPRLADPSDESAVLQERVRAYWDGNCSMCHAGADGTVTGWDARAITPS